jgi:hypothetical protein
MASNIRKQLANLSRFAEDENTTTPEGEETTAPAGTEGTDSDEAFLNAISACGITLANPESALKGQKWGKLGAFDLLNTNDFANQIMGAGNTQAAAKLVMDKVDQLDSALGGFEQYNKLGDTARKTLQVRMQQAKNPTDIVFLLSNSGLKGSGMSVAGLEAPVRRTKTALAKAGLERAGDLLTKVHEIIIDAVEEDKAGGLVNGSNTSDQLSDIANSLYELQMKLENITNTLK